MEAAVFSVELALFEEHRQNWLRQHPGAYVAIQDNLIAEGFYDSYADALRAGLAKFGVIRPFLVKQVWKDEPIYFVA